jgi:ABC-type multidrug transport system permease subunit
MYRVSPLTYLLEVLTVAVLADVELTCSSNEVQDIPVASSFSALTCGEYLKSYINDFGGRVLNQSDIREFQHCPVTNVNTILAAYGMNLDRAWRNLGFMALYVVFNIFAACGLDWAIRISQRNRL